jgi:hypothetical protein
MSLSMIGHVDDVFQSVPATRIVTGGAWADGIWVPSAAVVTEYVVNIQPATDQELDFLNQGAERFVDIRRIYINDGDMQSINATGDWEFLGLRWKSIKCDNRYWRDYCKVFVGRYDDQ